jgi:excisionase family DNA binding protein
MEQVDSYHASEARRRQRLLERLALPPVDVNSRYTVDEAIVLLRTSRTTLYHHIAAGNLRVLREGKRTFVPGSELARLATLGSAS